MIESLLLSAVRISTFSESTPLTNASGFFFERSGRLYLVSSRHVFIDEASEHFPDRIEIELHIDLNNLANSTGYSIPLYRNRMSIWRQATDSSGEVDVAVIEIDRSAFPADAAYTAFTQDHIFDSPAIEIDSSMLVVGFPLGFHDTLHHLPWRLLGVHSARLDLGTRDMELDEALGLNCTWFADILKTLTEA
ncbi:MAG: serine protease [Proteobacteria bacterium]|nr:serine protease [Pseudomonadota bacterium]